MLDCRGWLGSAQHIVKSKPSNPHGLRMAWREKEMFYCLFLVGARPPSHLEEVGQDLRVDPLLEDDLQDGGALTGEDVLTGPGLAQGGRAARSAPPLVGVNSPGEARYVRGAFTQDVHQGVNRPNSIVPLVAPKLYRLTGETGPCWSHTIIWTRGYPCWSSTTIRSRWSPSIRTCWSSTTRRSRWSCVITATKLYLCETVLSQ